jgi:hypothetical protein
MKQFFALTFLILSALTLRALQVDTVAMQQLIASGQRELCNAIEHNNTLRKAGATTGYRFFIAPDPPLHPNARVEYVGAQKGSTIPQHVIDTLNARCSRDYVQFGVELFLVHINSLDVVVNGQMPEQVNIRDLLVNGLYDEQNNIDTLRRLHKEIATRIVSGVAYSLNRTSLFYIVGDYCGVFSPNGKEGCWRYGRVSSFAGPGPLGDQADEFRDNFFRRTDAIGSMLLPDRLIKIEEEFRKSMLVYTQRQLITSSFHPNFLNPIFENFDDAAYADLTLEQRLHALHVYSGYTMLSSWGTVTSEESIVLKIIKYTPPEQAVGLLQGMEAPSTAVEGNSAYTGTTGGEALIYKLVDRTDDAIMFGPNNYQLLMKLISAACIKSPAAVDYCVGSTDVAQFTTVINWKDSYLLSNPPAGHIEYVVELKTSGKVSYTTKTARRVVTYVQAGEPVEVVEWDESTTAVELSPFSFVILNNTSNLSMIGDVMNGAGPQMVPAVMLKYCADKQFNDNAITACAVALDIVGVVTGPGLITAALRAGRLAVAAFEAVQLLGAAGNLVANNVNSPGLQAVINKYNAIVGIWGLTRIATAGTRYTLDYFTAAKSNQLSTITTVIADEYAGLYDAAKAEIDAAPEALKKPLSKMKELVGKGVSGGIVGTFNKSFIAGISGFSDNISSLAFQNGIDLTVFKNIQKESFVNLTVQQKVIVNNIRSNIPSPDVNTVLQKAIPKSEINDYLTGYRNQVGGYITTAKDAKHLNSFDEIYYGMRLDYSGTKFSLNDGSCGIIRYKVSSVNSIEIPKSPANGGNISDPLPFTGHGFTSAENGLLGVPEWKSDYLTPNEGAEIYEVFSDGREILRATFSSSLNRFISVQ